MAQNFLSQIYAKHGIRIDDAFQDSSGGGIEYLSGTVKRIIIPLLQLRNLNRARNVNQKSLNRKKMF